MARPINCRRVEGMPRCSFYKPPGIPLRALEVVTLKVDEFEALRLADLEGLYHEHAAKKMNISRQTFGRIIESARKKIADALVNGKALRIEGGEIEMPEMRTFKCSECNHVWKLHFGTGRPEECPACKSAKISRSVDEGDSKDKGRRQCGCHK
jgi:predicted DNA-binding protein (UPF0251 family)